MHLSNTTNEMIKLVVHRRKLRLSMAESLSFRELGIYRTEATESFQVTIIITNDLNSKGHVNRM